MNETMASPLMTAIDVGVRIRREGGQPLGITIFTPAPLPKNESQRNEAALASRLFDRVNDPELTAIARETRRLLNARWCGVTLVVGQAQHVVASSGGMLGIYRRSTSLSSYVVSRPDEVFVVLNTTGDERFAGNPFVADGLIAFYAGAAICDPAGFAIGALCVTEQKPRQRFSGEDASLLAEFADAVGHIGASDDPG